VAVRRAVRKKGGMVRERQGEMMKWITRLVVAASILALVGLGPSAAQAASPLKAAAGQAGQIVKRQSAPQKSAETVERWRYTFYNGTWWYWLPENRWVFWQDNRWNVYCRPQTAGRDYPASNEVIIGGPIYVGSRPAYPGGDEIGPFYGHALSRSF
jgi:hypothetical protein